MAATDPIQRHLTARIATATRWGKTSEVERLKREQRAALLERHIVEMISTWPPLTVEQCARLAALLAPPAGGEDQ